MPRFPPHHPLALALLVAGAVTGCQATTPPPATPAAKVVPAPITQPPPATQAQKDQAILQYAQISLMAGLAKRCQWLGDIEHLAVNAALKEREAWIRWQQLDMQQATAKANELAARHTGLVCDSAEGRQMGSGVAYGAWQMRSSWALRGYTLLPGPDQPGWYTGKSTTAQHRAALEAAIAGLKSIGTNAIDVSLERFRGEASTLLSVRCADKDKSCPAVEADPRYREYAEQVIQLTEAYANALESVQDKTGAPPK